MQRAWSAAQRSGEKQTRRSQGQPPSAASRRWLSLRGYVSWESAGAAAVIVAPDQPIDLELLRQRAQSRNERQQDQAQAEHHHHAPDESVGVSRGRERLDLVPERVEPQPSLARIAA